MTETVEVCDYCAAATCHVGEIAELRSELKRARETLREIRPLIAYANECAPTMSCGAALRMIDEAAHPMTETERIDGRIRDLAELCSRHGTPCADGLLAEIGRLHHDRDACDKVGGQLIVEIRQLRSELERTEGDLGVAIREAARAREALRFAREFIDAAPCQVPGIDTAVVLSMIEGALDQRLTQ